MKTIIVAIDNSPQAQNTLEYAASLAKVTKAGLVLLNSISFADNSAHLRIKLHLTDDFLKEKIKQLERMAVRIRSQYEIPVAYYTKLFSGQHINILAEQLEADMIIMGANNKNPNNKNLDELTASVIRHSNLPVFVVPERAEFKKPKRILFACDYKNIPCSYTLATIKLLALRFGAEVQIFHVENKDSKCAQGGLRVVIENEIQKMMKGVKHSFNELKEKDVLGGIEKGIRDFGADLLLMSPHKPGFFHSLIYKSMTREMALRGHVPTVALK